MSDDKKKKTGKKKSPLPIRLKGEVRQRKDTHAANTQRYLPFSEIRNDTVILKNGGLRAILQVEPINFNLKSETEQQGIVAGYEAFVNTLVFPLQILIRSTRVNIEPYLNHIHEHAAKQTSELLQGQTKAYAKFIERIVDIADIMQKRFYLVIPLEELPTKSRRSALDQFMSWMRHTDDSLAKVMQRNKRLSGQLPRLKERIDLVESGLHNIGITTKRLDTMEIIQLYYDIYNHDIIGSQKLPTDDLNTSSTAI